MSWASASSAAGQLHEHGVHAAAVLQVKVAADDRRLRSLEADGLAEGDVLLRDEGQVLDPACELRERVLTLQGELVRELLDERDELGRLGDEVGLASSIAIAPTGL